MERCSSSAAFRSKPRRDADTSQHFVWRRRGIFFHDCQSASARGIVEWRCASRHSWGGVVDRYSAPDHSSKALRILVATACEATDDAQKTHARCRQREYFGAAKEGGTGRAARDWQDSGSVALEGTAPKVAAVRKRRRSDREKRALRRASQKCAKR